MTVLRVVLIDDVREVREALAELIRNAGHEIVGEADDGATGVQATLAIARISSSLTGACRTWTALRRRVVSAPTTRAPPVLPRLHRKWRKTRAVVLAHQPSCAECGSPAEPVNHLQPIARGGTEVRAHLRPLCAAWNRGRQVALPGIASER